MGALYGVSNRARRQHLGFDPGLPRRRHPLRSQDPAQRVLRGSLQESEDAIFRLQPARHGHRQRRRRVAGAGERPAASFDRRLCKGPLNGPDSGRPAERLSRKAGSSTTCRGRCSKTCPRGQCGGTAEAPYAMWVDQQNTLGLGKNTPIATASQSDALEALVDGKWVVMRVPYPMSYLRQGHGRAHRRCERRLEGQGPVLDLFRPRPDRISKAARARPARWCTSRSVPILWRIDGNSDAASTLPLRVGGRNSESSSGAFAVRSSNPAKRKARGRVRGGDCFNISPPRNLLLAVAQKSFRPSLKGRAIFDTVPPPVQTHGGSYGTAHR